VINGFKDIWRMGIGIFGVDERIGGYLFRELVLNG